MDGLDFQEILLSNLENFFTLGAEYYGKKYVETIERVKKCSSVKNLKSISTQITDGDHGSSEYQESGIPYLLSEAVQKGYIESSKIRFISLAKHKELKRSALHPGDVVVTKTGVYFGKSAVIPQNLPEANMIAHVGKITLKEGYNPFYISSFLNSKYGYYQLRRRGIKATRPEIKLLEFDDILVPLFSEQLYSLVESCIVKSEGYKQKAEDSYHKAENLVLKELEYKPLPKVEIEIATKRFCESYGISGRLDAEYYQSKYDEITNSLKTNDNVESLCIIHDSNYLPDDDVEYQYIELADVGSNGEITGVESMLGNELPSRARRQVKKGQVIISSIEGSLQSCALILNEHDGALCSTGFYIIDSKMINSETLLVLFKSDPIQALLKQRCSGTILTAITKSELEKMPLPFIDETAQIKIAKEVSESFALRRKAEKLIDIAVRAVEIAIEKNEEEAIDYINNEFTLYE